MPDEQVFALASSVPLLGWAALAFAPRRQRGRAVAFARVLAVALAVGYVLLIAAALVGPPGPPVDLTTLSGLAAAFSIPRVMLIGWFHYLALDLWTGTWEVEEAGRLGMPGWVLAPCLLLTLLAGPAGLLLFLALRRRWIPAPANA